MKRFREDRQLAPIVAQFVPLHLDTGKPEWQGWARQHPHAGGNAIPIVYIVRADGETLYAQTGAPQGDELPQLLVTHLANAGKPLSAVQAQWFSEQSDKLAAALEQGDEATAFELIQSAARNGDPTQLSTFAAPALRFQELAQTVLSDFQSTLQEQRESWAELPEAQDEAAWLVAAMDLARVGERYRELRLVRAELSETIAEFKKNPQGRSVYSSADTLVKAMAAGDDAKRREREARKLQRLVSSHPESYAATQAKALLEEWGVPVEATPGSEATDEPESTEPQPREWTDRTGKFSVVAVFVEIDGEEVVLKREDNGAEIRVPLERLSSSDRRYLSRIDD